MMSPRRVAQLGILASTAVFVASLGILIANGGRSASEQSSPLPTLDPANAQTASISMSGIHLGSQAQLAGDRQ
jgi:hypothetical protein